MSLQTLRTDSSRKQDQCPVFKIDRQGRFVYIDAPTEKLLGVPAEELYVKNINEFLDNESYDTLRRIIDAGGSCETFYYPLDLNIINAAGIHHQFSCVVFLNFVAGNPANYQLILVPQSNEEKRVEVYEEESQKADIVKILINKLAKTSGETVFSEICELIIENEKILRAEIYRNEIDQFVIATSASRRPYSDNNKNAGKISESNLKSILGMKDYTCSLETEDNDTLVGNGPIIETGYPVIQKNNVTGMLRVFHEDFDDIEKETIEIIVRLIGLAWPYENLETPEDINDDNSQSDFEMIIEYMHMGVSNIDSGLDDIKKLLIRKNVKDKGILNKTKAVSEILIEALNNLDKYYNNRSANPDDSTKVDLNEIIRDVF